MTDPIKKQNSSNSKEDSSRLSTKRLYRIEKNRYLSIDPIEEGETIDKAIPIKKNFSLDKNNRNKNSNSEILNDLDDTGIYGSGIPVSPRVRIGKIIIRLGIVFGIAAAGTSYFKEELKQDDDEEITWTDHVRSYVNENIRAHGNDILLLKDKSLGDVKYVGEFSNGLPNGKGIKIGEGFCFKANWKNNEIADGAVDLEFENGVLYVGQYKDQRSHGLGKLTERDSLGQKSVYEGLFVKGKKHGKGVISWSELGNRYEGVWDNGQVVGPGKGSFTWENGNHYSGEWKDNRPHGQGTIKLKNGFNGVAQYEGSFRDGLRHGTGTFKWANGAEYTGHWKNGLPTDSKLTITWPDKRSYEGGWNIYSGQQQGYGTLKNADGSTYEGQWDQGREHGKGTFKWTNGDVYTGDWLKGERTGNGKIKWNNGNSYQGDFVDGTQSGQGTYLFNSGTRYEGGFLNNSFSGYGTMRWTDGDRYEGEFSKGERTGCGKFYWANGHRYDGDFVNGERTGYGKYYWPGNGRYEGDFVNGVRTGNGTRYFPGGAKYQGAWLRGKPNGRGTFVYKNGKSKSGTWENGCLKGWFGSRDCSYFSYD